MSRRLCRPPSCPRPRATNCAQRLITRSLWPLLVLSSLGVEFMSEKQVEKLPEDCGIMGHGLDLLSFERFGAKSFYQTRRFQAALI